jgi:hypothetical protein
MSPWIRAVGMVALMLTVGASAAAQAETTPGDIDDLMPTQIGDVTLHALPAEISTTAEQIRESFTQSGDFRTLFLLFGLDLVTVPFALVIDTDLEPAVAASLAGTLSDSDVESLLERVQRSLEEGFYLLGWRLEGVSSDEFMDAMVALSPDTDLFDATIAGRRVIKFPDSGWDTSTRVPAWGAVFGVEDALYLALAYGSEPTMLETLAALP